MTSPSQHRRLRSPRPYPCSHEAAFARRAPGFTLIELVVVVGIIALLAAIALPALSAMNRKAKRTRAAADLQTIATGLLAYQTDFGDYPRVSVNGTGFAVLGKALISPGPGGGFPAPTLPSPVPAGSTTSVGTPGTAGYEEYVAVGLPLSGGGFGTSTSPPGAEWASLWASDGKDGPGFRARSGGKPYGPYLPAEKFRLRGLAILDQWDNPILYSPARPVKPAPDPSTGEWLFVAQDNRALYDANHNLSFFKRHDDIQDANAVKRMEAILVQPGQNDFDAVMENGEQPATTGPFLLWSAGADGHFGVTYAGVSPTKDEIVKCDDVTNFTTGQ